MRFIKFTAFLILISLVIPLNLFSWISSRIEGTIVDEETGAPIINALVSLYMCKSDGDREYYTEEIDNVPDNRVETDRNGKFVFNDLKNGEYFLQVFKEGYAAVGPRVNYDWIYEGIGRLGIRLNYQYMGNWSHDKPGEIKRFLLKEGQIKHLSIKLEKEAILLVKLFEKTTAGTTPRDFRIEAKHSEYVDKLYGNSIDGEFKSKYLGEGKINLRIIIEAGYHDFFVDNIELKKGTTTTIERTCDYTIGQGIFGVITNKLTGQPIVISICIQKSDYSSNLFCTSTDKSGKFRIGGLDPGKYFLDIDYSDLVYEYEYTEIITLSSNEIKEYNKAIILKEIEEWKNGLYDYRL
jgi:hypothetical protein